MNGTSHGVKVRVDYFDPDLNRLTSFFRIFTVIPIAIVLGAVGMTEPGVELPRG